MALPEPTAPAQVPVGAGPRVPSPGSWGQTCPAFLLPSPVPRARGLPGSFIFVFNTEGNFGGLLIAIPYFIKGRERERFEGHLQIEIAESLIAADIRDHLVL